MCDAQVLFLCDLSESVLSLLWVFPFCGVSFDGASFLGMSLELLAALSHSPFHAWKSVSHFSWNFSFWDLLPQLLWICDCTRTVPETHQETSGRWHLGGLLMRLHLHLLFLRLVPALASCCVTGGACCIITDLPRAHRLCF